MMVYGVLVKPYSLNMPHRVEAKWAHVVMCWSVSLTRTKVIFNARRTIKKLFAMLVRPPISSDTSQNLTCLLKNTKKTTKLRLSKSKSLHRCRSIQIQNLQTGHSHEDIDQWFSVIASVVERHSELHCPRHFVHALNEHFRGDQSSRSHESEREAFLVDSVREWKLGVQQLNDLISVLTINGQSSQSETSGDLENE